MIPSRDLLKWIERIAQDSYAQGYADALASDELKRETILAEVWETIERSERDNGAGGTPCASDSVRASRAVQYPSAPSFKDGAGTHPGTEAMCYVADAASSEASAGASAARVAPSPSNVVAIHLRRPDGKFHL